MENKSSDMIETLDTYKVTFNYLTLYSSRVFSLNMLDFLLGDVGSRWCVIEIIERG